MSDTSSMPWVASAVLVRNLRSTKRRSHSSTFGSAGHMILLATAASFPRFFPRAAAFPILSFPASTPTSLPSSSSAVSSSLRYAGWYAGLGAM